MSDSPDTHSSVAVGSDGHADFSPVFIVGHPRSGTTLLAALLDRNSRIAVTPETSFFINIQPALIERFPDPAALVDHVCGQTRVKDLRLPHEQVLGRYRQFTPSLQALFRSILETYAGVRKKELGAEKSPLHLRCIPAIVEMFPSARIVWIQRDGRDSVLSLRRVDWASDSLWELCLQWKRNMLLGLRYAACYPRNVFVVKYEDLVGNPAGALERLHEFLGVQYEENQLDETHSVGVVPSWEMAWKGKALGGIDHKRVQAWKQTASETEKCLMASIMGKELRALGYGEVDTGHCGLRVKVLGWVGTLLAALITQRHVHAYLSRNSARGR